MALRVARPPWRRVASARRSASASAASAVADGKRRAVAEHMEKIRAQQESAALDGERDEKDRGQKKAQEERQRAGEQGQARADACELERGQRAKLRRRVLKAAPPSACALGDEEKRDADKQECCELICGERIAQGEPGAIDAGGEGGHAEIGDRAEIGERFHERESGARDDGGTRERQRDAPKRAPRPVAQAAAHLQHARGLLEKGGAREKVDVWVEHEREHDGGTRQRADGGKPIFADLKARECAQDRLRGAGSVEKVRIRISHDIGGHGERQDERPVENTAQRKRAHGGEPCGCDADKRHARADAEHESARVGEIEGQHRARQMRPIGRGAGK